MNERSTTQRLLDATLEQVATYGVAGTTSRQISSAAGTNLQAITYHFGSKDELVAQALVGAVRSWTEPVRSMLAEIPSDPTAALTVALDHLDATATRVSDQLPAYLEALALVPRSPTFRDQIQPLFDDLRHAVADAIRQLCDAGLLGTWVEPDTLAALVVAAADGVAIHSVLDPDGPTPTELLQQAGGLLLAALVHPT